MNKLLFAFVSAGALLCAQTPEPQKPTQRIYEIKYGDVTQVLGVCSNLRLTNTRFSESLRTISAYGPTEELDQMGECIKRIDAIRPAPTSRNVEIVATMMLLSPKGTAGEAVPADLEPVVKQLKAIFGFNDFRILETAILRNREGMKGETIGLATNPGSGQPSSYQLRYLSATVSKGEKATVIRLDDVRFNMRMTYTANNGSMQNSDIGFNTNLDIREGQKVVVGKAKIDGSDNALVLVISARAVE